MITGFLIVVPILYLLVLVLCDGIGLGIVVLRGRMELRNWGPTDDNDIVLKGAAGLGLVLFVPHGRSAVIVWFGTIGWEFVGCFW